MLGCRDWGLPKSASTFLRPALFFLKYLQRVESLFLTQVRLARLAQLVRGLRLHSFRDNEVARAPWPLEKWSQAQLFLLWRGGVCCSYAPIVTVSCRSYTWTSVRILSIVIVCLGSTEMLHCQARILTELLLCREYKLQVECRCVLQFICSVLVGFFDLVLTLVALTSVLELSLVWPLFR